MSRETSRREASGHTLVSYRRLDNPLRSYLKNWCCPDCAMSKATAWASAEDPGTILVSIEHEPTCPRMKGCPPEGAKVTGHKVGTENGEPAVLVATEVVFEPDESEPL